MHGQNVGLFAKINNFALADFLCTSFTVWLSILHVKRAAPDWLLASSADKTRHMPGLFQGIHDFLQGKMDKKYKQCVTVLHCFKQTISKIRLIEKIHTHKHAVFHTFF